MWSEEQWHSFEDEMKKVLAAHGVSEMVPFARDRLFVYDERGVIVAIACKLEAECPLGEVCEPCR